MWTADNRPRYNRDKLRYPSDLTDAEWAHIEPLIPPGKPGGGKRRVAIREVINGVMYILSTGCQWRALPKDLPPRSTVHDYLGLWNWDGTLDRIHHALYLKCREKAAREASPTACIIDSQSVKSAEKAQGGSHRQPGRLRCRQADQGQEAACSGRYARLAAARHRHRRRRSGSRSRTNRSPMLSRWPRDGGLALLATLFGLFPFLGKLFADSAYQGNPVFHRALAGILPDLETEIVKRSDRVKGFVVQPRRWVVERTIAWLNRCRRLAKDWENLNRNALAFIKLASIRLMLRKLCNPA